MKGIADYFSISTEYTTVDEISFPEHSLLFHGTNTVEERNALSKDFSKKHPKVEVIFINELENQEIKLLFIGNEEIISLRSDNDSKKLRTKLEGRNIFIDITALTHSTWGWLIKSLLFRKTGFLTALYSEPIEYKFHEAPLDGQIFDLSEKINGIAPLPSYASLSRYTSDDFIFMPLLGFEGARLAHIIEDVQPKREFTFPVIGVPGFRHDFPFYTYQGNRLTLEREGVWKNWRFEKANCPASIYTLGTNILNEYQDKTLRIAPIGTKPHALGAVLLKLAYPFKVDIIYDHPLRKTGRTKGKSKTISYLLNPFMELITTKW